MRVREAEDADIAVIHSLGANAPELNVGGMRGAFPTLDELETSINVEDIWLVLESDRGHVLGFCCARPGDSDGRGHRSACLVYLFVEALHRRKGFARMLWDGLLISLGAGGVDHVYTWANPTSGVVEFFERQGFSKGKPCIWMDVDLSPRSPRADKGAP